MNIDYKKIANIVVSNYTFESNHPIIDHYVLVELRKEYGSISRDEIYDVCENVKKEISKIQTT